MKSFLRDSDRMEIFEGQNKNLIINATSNWDVETFKQELDYQFSSHQRDTKIVVLDFSTLEEVQSIELLKIVESYHPSQLFILENGKMPAGLQQLENASIFFKGTAPSFIAEIVQLFKNRKHKTWVEFDLKAITHNLSVFQSKVHSETKTLVMVKASSYGTGDLMVPHFLQQCGIDYLGVAYTDEGTTLRENGINLPILVMNTEEEAFGDLVRFNLEPSLFSMQQLEAFIRFLNKQSITDYPIHLTFETGMNRLGFHPAEIPNLIQVIKKSPELQLKSVYSHLADADNTNLDYTNHQIARFTAIRTAFKAAFNDSVLFHILNSEGTSKLGDIAAFDMIRLGIGVFGYTSTAKQDDLMPFISWWTTISQIKEIEPGETIGYGRTFKADKPMKIATLRIGYADGFRRSLSNGIGIVFIDSKPCSVVGNVCMDMTMIDVTDVACQNGDHVEIIGNNTDMFSFSKRLKTIPYEVMTSLNKRVSRVYLK